MNDATDSVPRDATDPPPCIGCGRNGLYTPGVIQVDGRLLCPICYAVYTDEVPTDRFQVPRRIVRADHPVVSSPGAYTVKGSTSTWV